MSVVFDVVVVGSGFAGWSAAAAASEAGASVALLDGGPGASAFWSGLADVHGPAVAAPAAQTPHRLRRSGAEPFSEPRDLSERHAALAAQWPDHPYLRAGQSPSDVAATVTAAARRIGLPLEPGADAVFATDAATLRVADLALPGIARFAGDARIGVLAPAALGTFDGEWVARAVRAAGGQAESITIGEALPLYPSLAAAQRIGAAAALRTSGALAGARRGDIDAWLVPPLFPREAEAAHAERAAWGEALGAPVYELAGTVDSPFGARALCSIRQHLATAVEVIAGRVDGQPVRDGAVWQAGPLAGRALVLATGGVFVTRRPDAAAAAPEPTARSPWRAQPFLAEGLATDADGRVLGMDGPAFAAGSALAGHDPAHDGTAFGVALWSGARAGAAAAAEVR